jgi:UDP:flavonoid glycosyltransferase YjiC (YdhE family)
MIVPHLRDIYDDLDAATECADLLITHPFPFVGPIIAQKKRLNWISSVLAPASFLSVYDPVVPPQWPSLHRALRLSPWIGRGVIALAKIKMDKILRPVYELRAELGMARGEQPILNGQHSPTKVLALFSKLLATPQRDWPANTVVTGSFPLYDRRDFFGETEIPNGLIDFLESGPPPIVFTLGSTAFWVAHNFYRDSIEVARVLGRRALVLIGHARNMPPLPLPEGVAAFEYAPYSEGAGDEIGQAGFDCSACPRSIRQRRARRTPRMRANFAAAPLQCRISDSGTEKAAGKSTLLGRCDTSW